MFMMFFCVCCCCCCWFGLVWFNAWCMMLNVQWPNVIVDYSFKTSDTSCCNDISDQENPTTKQKRWQKPRLCRRPCQRLRRRKAKKRKAKSRVTPIFKRSTDDRPSQPYALGMFILIYATLRWMFHVHNMDEWNCKAGTLLWYFGF